MISIGGRAVGGALAGLATALVLTACGSQSSAFHGAELDKPLTMPGITLTDTAGQPYNVTAATKGLTTLMFFGYTHCPDECPTTMADLGTALRSLPADVSKNVQVVFITSDPQRDTPAVLHKWLSNFDGGLARPFVGLTGSIPAIDAYGGKMGVYLEPPKIEADGTVDVVHGAETIAFSPQDGKARVVWLTGTSSKDYASDITKIAAGQV